MYAKFMISLDFEMFWGITDQQYITSYADNILGEWQAIPKILTMFRRHDIKATWATVGMLMCRDYKHWHDLRPNVLPNYKNSRFSTYSLARIAKEHPKMFFGRPLVELILQTPGQEVGGHTYSHFYCLEPDVTFEQFSEDLRLAQEVALEFGIKLTSFVFPRNQFNLDYIELITGYGYRVYRGNQSHILYSNGHYVPGGALGKGFRLLDSYISISGYNTKLPDKQGPIVNCAASTFLRPWSRHLSAIEPLRVYRIKRAMLEAAKNKTIFHLWWHPHNFGINLDQNISILDDILAYYNYLNAEYGMASASMGDVINTNMLSLSR